MKTIIALSGPVAVGKSGFCDVLVQRFGARLISTREILLGLNTPNEREALIARGNQLDEETGGAWVANGLDNILDTEPDADLIIVDSVRKLPQLVHARALADRRNMRLFHVHLTAARAVLAARYSARATSMIELPDYSTVWDNPIEVGVRALADEADVVISTDLSQPASVAARAMAGLGLYPREPDRLVDVLVGAQYGSEGKGNICAFLAPSYDVLMRVGGPNAGHKVAHPKYTYVQLPSGTGSNPRAEILIGAGATIWLPQILKEIGDWKLGPDRLFIDPQAMIIETADQAYEAVSMDSIGSTKKGVGAATARKILGRDTSGDEPLGTKVRLAKNAPELKDFVNSLAVDRLERAYARGSRIMLEGTQGTSLSLHHGAWPYVTSRETTASGCLADAGIAPTRVNRVMMVTRTYPIRVGGTSGDMETEINFETVAERSGLPVSDIQMTEVGTVSGKKRRIGEFEWEQLRKSAVLNGVTDVALTFVDYIDGKNRLARRFEQLSPATRDFIAEVERVANAPVSLISTRFEERNIIDRRTWA